MTMERTDLERLSTPELERLLGTFEAGVPAGQILYGIVPGDTVRVTATISYKGPALSDSFYAAIGNRMVYFDEIWKKEVPFSWASSTSFVTKTLVADILITEVGLFPWTPGFFDLYCKIKGYLAAGLPELANVIEILLKSQFQNFNIVSYDKV